jgi:hypothetical protein
VKNREGRGSGDEEDNGTAMSPSPLDVCWGGGVNYEGPADAGVEGDGEGVLVGKREGGGGGGGERGGDEEVSTLGKVWGHAAEKVVDQGWWKCGKGRAGQGRTGFAEGKANLAKSQTKPTHDASEAD